MMQEGSQRESDALSAGSTWFMFRRQALRSWLLRFAWLARGVYIGEGARIPGAGKLEIARSASVQRYSVLNARSGACIRIGSGTRIGAFAVISAGDAIEIGHDVLIADRVFISDHHHEFMAADRPVIEQGSSVPKPVSIGAGCWLGINVCIMPGVTLGAGCIVGAGSVVTRSFGAGSIVGGVPAQLIRLRAEDAE
jgi:acetyltransferase-like isoleucine patch superfamily enzyme